jgi:type II secretory pathway pseudopilin PulG
VKEAGIAPAFNRRALLRVQCVRDADLGAGGFTALELLLAVAIVLTVAGVSVPLVTNAMDAISTGMAARYVEGRIMDARMHAIRRSACVALRFESQDDDYGFAEYVDGNGNGVRTTEILAGIDVELAPQQRLRALFAGVSFGLRPDVPDADGRGSSGTDGVRIGTSRILTLGPDGTATSGTVYVRGRRAQYAIRILGATGRTRVLRFEPGEGQWLSR